MRQYELAMVVAPEFSEDKVKALQAKVEEFIKSEKGKVTKKDFWPKKSLAYILSKKKEGQFVFLNFELLTLSKGFSQKVKLTDGVLRFLLLKN